MTDRRDEERKRTQREREGDERRQEESERRSDELKEAWRRNHPREGEEGGPAEEGASGLTLDRHERAHRRGLGGPGALGPPVSSFLRPDLTCLNADNEKRAR